MIDLFLLFLHTPFFSFWPFSTKPKSTKGNTSTAMHWDIRRVYLLINQTLVMDLGRDLHALVTADELHTQH